MFSLAILALTNAQAATLDVCAPSTVDDVVCYPNIQAAVSAAASGDVIQVHAGEWAGFNVVNKSNLTIRAAAGAAPVVRPTTGSNLAALIFVRLASGVELSGLTVRPGAARAILAETATTRLTLRDMTFEGGRTNQDGAALQVLSGARVDAIDSVFQDFQNGATTNGGILHVAGGSTLTLTNTDVTGGLARNGSGAYVTASTLTVDGGTWSGHRTHGSGDGGAIRAVLGSTVTLRGVTLVDNTAARHGGHVSLSASTLNASDSTFDQGSAVNGGVVYADVGTVTLTDCALSNGVASQGGGLVSVTSGALTATRTEFDVGEAAHGGAIAADETIVVLTTSVFDGGAVSGDGGHVWLDTGQLTATNTLFVDGAARGDGGSVFVRDATTRLTDVDFDATTAGGDGGALLVTGTGPLTWTGGSSSGAVADGCGGAVATSGLAGANLEGVWISGATADLGGAVCHEASVALFAVEVDVDECVADDGGGLYSRTSPVSITSSRFRSNLALGQGGAAWVAGGTLFAVDSDFTGNVASTGGAVSFSGLAWSTMRTLWCGNEADENGGALALGEVSFDVRLANDRFAENTAGGAGGALYGKGVGDPLLTHLTFAGNSAASGGAVTLVSTPFTLESSILAYNDGGGVVTDGGSEVTLTHDAWWQNDPGDVLDPTGAVALDETHLFADPLLQGFVADGLCDDVLWVAATSPTIDAGPAAELDPRGSVPSARSPSDLGAYGGPDASLDAWTDADDDGWPVMWDCDDDDASTQALTHYADADGDGFGDPSTAADACAVPPDRVADGGDCDDRDLTRFPGAPEVCDDVDQDCDGDVDEDAIDAVDWRADADDDGFGAGPAVTACAPPDASWTDVDGDCDDTDASAFPGAVESCDLADDDCDGAIDEDAVDGLTFWQDDDRDGFGGATPVVACALPDGAAEVGGDCDDGTFAINPGVEESCDGVDDDCDGDTDEAGALGSVDAFVDADDDGWGDEDLPVRVCPGEAGASTRGGDCDDQDDATHPEADEICDGDDDDCDGDIDDNPVGTATWYRDVDEDGFGDPASTQEGCARPDGYVRNGTDCDDTSNAVHPAATEVCNTRDDDCDGRVDLDAADGVRTYLDGDGDGFGDDTTGKDDCAVGVHETEVGGDCDDTRDSVYPGAPDLCGNDRDDDCDGDVDEETADRTFFADDDRDGFGDDDDTFVGCAPPDGDWVVVGGDCDPTDGRVHPDAVELWYDGTDQDCDGNDVDADLDGYPAEVTGGPDCDDQDDDTYPGAPDALGDGVDQDCDGADGAGDRPNSRTWEPGVVLPALGCSCDQRGGAGVSAGPIVLLALGLARRRRIR